MIDLTEILQQQKAELIQLKKLYPEFTTEKLSLLTSERFFNYLADRYGWRTILRISSHYVASEGIKAGCHQHSYYDIDVTDWSQSAIAQKVGEELLYHSSKHKDCADSYMTSSIIKRPDPYCYNTEEARYYFLWLDYVDLETETNNVSEDINEDNNPFIELDELT